MWTSFIATVVKLLAAVAAAFQERQLINAGRAEQSAATLQETVNDLTIAVQARDDAERNVAAGGAGLAPDGSVQDDGFRRD